MSDEFYLTPKPFNLLRSRRPLPWVRLSMALALGTGLGLCYPAVSQEAPGTVASAPSTAGGQQSARAPVEVAIEPPLGSPEAQAHAPIPDNPVPEFVDHEGTSQAEWNRAAVQELPRVEPKAGRPPKPTAKDRAGIYPSSTGVWAIQDDPSSERVYPLDCLVSHCTVIQTPGVVVKAWCGDLTAWKLEGGQTYVSIKPLAGDLSTNLHILTEAGRLYSFRLWSHETGDYTDLFTIRGSGAYLADQGALEKKRVDQIKQELSEQYEAKLKDAQEKQRFDWVKNYAQQTAWDYRVEQPPNGSFTIRGVFNDEHFTYFHASGDEKPTIFLEAKQGHKWVRELCNFEVTGGDFYRVQKLIMTGQRFVLKLRASEAIISRRGS